MNRFLLGNVVLFCALVLLLFMERAWLAIGFFAVLAWMALAALGVWLIVSDREERGPPGPPN